MVHTAVVLPGDLLERLRRDAAASGQGLSAEIRRRLQLTYDLERLPHDSETKDLVRCIENLAENLAGDLGKKWHEQGYALAAFKAGVAAFLAHYNPKGDASIRLDTRLVGESDDQPETVGRTHARLIWIASHPRIKA